MDKELWDLERAIGPTLERLGELSRPRYRIVGCSRYGPNSSELLRDSSAPAVGHPAVERQQSPLKFFSIRVCHAGAGEVRDQAPTPVLIQAS